MTAVRDGLAAFALVWRHARRPAIAQYVLAFVTGLLPPAAAWAGKLLFDAVQAGADGGTVLARALLVAAVGVLIPLLSATAAYLGSVVETRLRIAVENDLFHSVGRSVGVGPFEDPDYLDRLRLAEQSAADAPTAIAGFVATALQGGASVIGMLAAVLTVWPPMAALVALCVVAHVIAQRALSSVQVRTAEIVGETFRRQYVFRSALTDARSVKELRLFGLTGFFHDRMMSTLGRSTAAQLLAQRREAQLGAALSLLTGVCAAVGLVMTALRAARGGLTIGDLTLFLAAAAGVQSGLQGIVQSWGHARTNAILFATYRALVGDAPDLPDGIEEAQPLRHAVEFRDVWFRYSDDSDWVLRGLDLRIEAGQSLALVGLNGAGKSTIVKLLCRLHDPDRGQVLWDGVDVRQLSAKTLRARLSATFQDYMPYDLSARENIGIGDLPRVDDDAAVAGAAQRAGATFLEALPRGIDTLLSRSFDDADADAGVTLSGGQWQRVALARSLMRVDADLLILDEPSSGLDAQAEAEVHRALRRHRAGRTSVLISHRLGAVREADEIVVLEGGRIVEHGSHLQLLARGGEYARLFRLQAAGYVDGALATDPGIELAG